MIPVFVAVFYCGMLTPWCYLASAVIFLLAAATDALDGHIARSRHLVTNFGKFLDPIADKVLVSSAFIVILTIPTAFGTFMWGSVGIVTAGVCIALILARELIVSGFRIIAAERNLVLAADKLGKIKTTMQDIAVAFILVAMTLIDLGMDQPTQSVYVAGTIIAYIGLACLVICTLLTVISGANYLIKNKAVLKDEETAQQKTQEEQQ